MTIDTWLEHAVADAERRGLPALRPLLEALARSTAALRSADWRGADWHGAEWDSAGWKDTGPDDAVRHDGATGDRRASTNIHER